MAEWSTAYMNDLPDSAFLYIEPGGSKDSEGKTKPRSLRHFPYKDASGAVDLPHLRNALSRIPQSNMSADVKARLTAKAQRILADRRAGMSVIESEFRSLDATDELFQLRDDGDEMPTLVGHFAVFDQWTEINSRFEGQFLERMAPGAFDKTFAENRRNMRVLFQHGKDPEVGEKILGPIAELRSEQFGAYYEVPLFKGVPQLLVSGLGAGEYGSSFRFRAMKEEWNERAEASEYNPNGLRERTITEAKVMEFGPVTFPAYEGASAGLRSITDWWIEQDLRHQLEVFGGNRAVALEPEVKVETSPNFEPSRRTRVVDHLSTGEEDKPWRL